MANSTIDLEKLPFPYRPNMRGLFAYLLCQEMKKNQRIWVVVNDLGYRMFDQIRAEFPDRFINVGAAEQAMLGIAVGLALEGKIPVVYSITSFLLFRPFETIRNYLHYEKIPVKLIGAGRDLDYSKDGLSHWAPEDKKIMKIFTNIQAHWPKRTADLSGLLKKMLADKNPWYINLEK